MKYLVALSIFFLSFTMYSNVAEENPAAYSYIDTYKDLAVVEMYRSGIPASIILAQGMHESGMGSSRLATEANNHFGIKCKREWAGRTFAHKDDDYDTFGNLTESCFRAYDSALDSYIDHSNFLMHRKYYKELFNLHRTDYKSWAYGLKKCGYATDPNYAEILIDKIERFKLYEYDSSDNPFNYKLD